MESSGCGSRIIAPFLVVFLFFASRGAWDMRLSTAGCCGRDEADILAGAFRSPRGSLR